MKGASLRQGGKEVFRKISSFRADRSPNYLFLPHSQEQEEESRDRIGGNLG
jgi:hypothetical protein